MGLFRVYCLRTAYNSGIELVFIRSIPLTYGGETGTRTQDTMIFSHVRCVSGRFWRSQNRIVKRDSSFLRCSVSQVVAPGYCQTTVDPRNPRVPR